MYEFKNGNLTDTEKEPGVGASEIKVEVGELLDILAKPIVMTLEEYRRFVTAEILLRVLLAADIGAYGTGNGVIDAARKVYAEEYGEEAEGENDAE